MGYSVKQCADVVGTFRWIAVHAMETLARWIPTTPEMESKVLFGRHVWDFAQHADALGKRAFELRAPLQYSRPPTAEYRALLDEIAALTCTADRVAGFYDGWCSAMAARYRRHIATTDVLMDEPTVAIVERALFDLQRFAPVRARLAAELPAATFDVERWRAREAALACVADAEQAPADAALPA